MKPIVSILLLGIASTAEACPFCGTETSLQVCDNIFNGDFLATVGQVLLPFPILLLAVVAIDRLSDRW